MAKIVLLQFETDPESAQRRKTLAGIGAEVVEDVPRWPTFFQTVERVRPDAVVIACGAIASHGREAARYLGDGFNTRNIPVVLVDVPAAEIAMTRESAPAASIVDRGGLAEAVRTRIS
jgi:hypothetical protein